MQNFATYRLASGYVSYDPTGGTYSVLGATFGSADLVSGSAGETASYAKPDSATGSTARFDFARPSPGTYSRVASVLIAGQARGSYCVLGVPTLNTDIPTAPAVSFATISVRGRAYDRRSGALIEYDLASSTATLLVDLTTGQFTSRLTLTGSAGGGSGTALGTYEIAGSLVEMTSGLTGGPAGGPRPNPTPGTPGAIFVNSIRADGGFFGPQGREFAYVFSRSESTGSSTADVTFSFFGTVAGSR